MSVKKHRLAALLSVSEMPITERDRMEIVRKGSGHRILLNGVRRILQYGDTEMRFAVRDGRVGIVGQGLCCTAYDAGCVSIDGRVTGVFFLEEGEP